MSKVKHTNQEWGRGAFADYSALHIPAWLGGMTCAMVISMHGYRGNYFYALTQYEFLFVVSLYYFIFSLLMSYINRYTVSLDREQPWQQGWVQRCIYQSASCVVIPLFVIIILHKVMSMVLPAAIRNSSYLHIDAFLFLLLLLLVNGWCAAAYLLHRNMRLGRIRAGYRRRMQRIAKLREDEEHRHMDKIASLESASKVLQQRLEDSLEQQRSLIQERDHYIAELKESEIQRIISDTKLHELQDVYKRIKDGPIERAATESKSPAREDVLIVTTADYTKAYKDEEVAYLTTENEHVFVGMLSGERLFYRKCSLNSMEEELKMRGYMRVNRKYLVPLSAVGGAVERANKKIVITLLDKGATQLEAYKEGAVAIEVHNWLLRKVTLVRDNEIKSAGDKS